MTQETAMSPRKVLYIVTKATSGGAQRYVFDLATHLPAGYSPAVAYGVHGMLADNLNAAGITTHEIAALGRDVALLSDIKSCIAIWRCIGELRPDIVHLNSSKAAALGALAARLRGVRKIVFTVHGWPFKENRGAIARSIIWHISWFTALLSHAVIVVSSDDERLARRMPFIRGKVALIHNGIELPMQFGSGDQIRAAFPPGATITGTIGELTANKNQSALIEQARRDSALCVAIVGEGEDRAMLEKKIQEYGLGDRVKLFGFIPAADVLHGFDQFALPSLKEGLPYVLLEAKAAGLPIDANPVGGVPEILAGDLADFSLTKMVDATVALYR